MTEPSATPIASRTLDEVLADAPAFVRAAGLVVEDVTPTRVTGYVELGPDHHQAWGIVHGGVYAACIESAASIGASVAVLERGQIAVGLTNTTHFLRPMVAGRVDVTAIAVHQGRQQQLWQVDVVDDAGRPVARGEVRLQNVDASRRPG